MAIDEGSDNGHECIEIPRLADAGGWLQIESMAPELAGTDQRSHPERSKQCGRLIVDEECLPSCSVLLNVLVFTPFEDLHASPGPVAVSTVLHATGHVLCSTLASTVCTGAGGPGCRTVRSPLLAGTACCEDAAIKHVDDTRFKDRVDGGSPPPRLCREGQEHNLCLCMEMVYGNEKAAQALQGVGVAGVQDIVVVQVQDAAFH